jgi:uncharacterized OB-fold protein
MSVGPVGRNRETEDFFEGTARGEFLLMRGGTCGHWNRPQAVTCRECGATDLEARPASGRARLESWAVVHPRPREGVDPQPPTVPAIVELEEGPWWWTRIVDADVDRLAGGQALRVRFERPEGSEAVPVFAPAVDD